MRIYQMAGINLRIEKFHTNLLMFVFKNRYSKRHKTVPDVWWSWIFLVWHFRLINNPFKIPRQLHLAIHSLGLQLLLLIIFTNYTASWYSLWAFARIVGISLAPAMPMPNFLGIQFRKSFSNNFKNTRVLYSSWNHFQTTGRWMDSII